MFLVVMLSVQWLALFLEHALGWYGGVIATLLIGIGMIPDEKRRWLFLVHAVVLSVCTDAVFGRPLGVSAMMYGVMLSVWMVAATLSRARMFVFMVLGLIAVGVFHRDDILRAGVVLVVIWMGVRGVRMQHESQEMILK